MISFGAVEVDYAVEAGRRIDDAVGNQRFFTFIGFDFVELSKIRVIVVLVIDVISHKLHGNGSGSVKAFAFPAV